VTIEYRWAEGRNDRLPLLALRRFDCGEQGRSFFRLRVQPVAQGWANHIGQFQAAANVLSIFFLWRTRSIGISGNVDRRHHASRDLTKPHIGLEILPRRRFGFLLRDHLMRSSTVVCATFSTRAIARMPSPF
jgi:hypothetical protein